MLPTPSILITDLSNCLLICGDTEGTLSSTLCRFLMYFILILYNLNRLLITPPVTQEAMQMHSLLTVSVATENSHIVSTYKVGLT